MVLRWMKAATKDLRAKIDRGEINPNIQTAIYLGNVVSGEHYPDTKPLPLMIVEPLLFAFVDCSCASSLSRNCKAINWQKEEEK
jgi:hypothetical protein